MLHNLKKIFFIDFEYLIIFIWRSTQFLPSSMSPPRLVVHSKKELVFLMMDRRETINDS